MSTATVTTKPDRSAAAPVPAALPTHTGGQRHHAWGFPVLIVVTVAVVAAGLAVGSVTIPLNEVINVLTGQPADPIHQIIVRDIRGPRTITAVLVGAGLGVSGLQMQTLFRNPLADPYILGISSGASFGVALVVLGAGAGIGTASFTSGLGLRSDVLLMIAAGAGSAVVMFIVLAVGRFVKSSITLLLLGVMIGYFVSSGVTVLLSRSSPELISAYVSWQFGSYHGVTWDNIKVLVPVMLLGLIVAFFLAKPLNALLLGERYAQTMGMNLKATRAIIVLCTAMLAGAATAFCGPISFLGIAVPHLTRAIMGTSDHRTLLPACMLTGASVALTADILAQLPGDNVLPINAVNAAFGAPVVIAILIRSHRSLGV